MPATRASIAPWRIAGRWDDVVSTELFRARDQLGWYDVMPDGQSFLVNEYRPGDADAHIHVATGW